MDVRRIRPGDWEALRGLRLRALADAPHAFASSLERESDEPDEWWQEWAREDAESDTDATFFALDGDQPVGLAACYVRAGEPNRVTVVAMWVAPEARRGGTGRDLLRAVEAWAVSIGAEWTNLSVTDTNPEAHDFYLACGYTDTGTRKPLDRDPSITEISMRRPTG